MRPAAGILALLALTAASARAGAQQATRTSDTTRVAWGRVTYISGPTIYVDAGSKAGLAEGSLLEVVRGGQAIARLRVAFISSSRSACSIVDSRLEVAVGDSARFTPVAAVTVAAADTGAARAAPRPGARHDAVRGRAGVRYLMVDPGGGLARWTQPAFDLRLDGHQVGGSPLGVVVDVRAYRERAGATGSGAAASTRVYQGNLEWSPAGSPLRVSAGRQLTPSLSTIGIFDGVSLELNGSRVSVGAVGGSQPDAATFGLSGVVREYGAYVQAHSTAGGSGTWSVTMGGIGSYDRGRIDREFAWLQTIVTHRRVSFFATQELDVNRGWKADVEGRSTVPTATFAMLRVSPHDAVSVNLGYDNRRSVRLYRDFVDPVTEFDDAFRQGAWGGVSVSAGSHVRLDTDVRQSRGGTGGDARSFTGSFGVFRLTPLGLGARVRATEYDGSTSRGRLASGSVELNPWNRFRLEASGGTRRDARPTPGLPQRTLTWQGLNADFGLGRSVYVLLSGYQERGDAGRSRQGYAALSWRF